MSTTHHTPEGKIKNDSYAFRAWIADAIGAPAHHDFTVARYRATCSVVLDDGRVAFLRSTSNAGFRGIEGYFQALDGSPIYASLGRIREWEVR